MLDITLVPYTPENADPRPDPASGERIAFINLSRYRTYRRVRLAADTPADVQDTLDFLRGDDVPDEPHRSQHITIDRDNDKGDEPISLRDIALPAGYTPPKAEQRASLKAVLAAEYRGTTAAGYPLGEFAPVTANALREFGFQGDEWRLATGLVGESNVLQLCFSFKPVPGDVTPRAWLQYYRLIAHTTECVNIPIPMPQTMDEVARLLDLLKIQVP